MSLCKYGKSALSKVRTNLKRHNRVYILSSKHSYRPMRARAVAQLFYKKQDDLLDLITRALLKT